MAYISTLLAPFWRCRCTDSISVLSGSRKWCGMTLFCLRESGGSSGSGVTSDSYVSEKTAWSSLTYIFGSLLFFLLLTRGLFFVWFSKRKIKTHLQIQASFITPFIFFLLSPCPLGPSLPGKRTCTSAEFVQRQTAHYLQEWNIKERRSGTCSPNTPLSSPEKPGVYHENCGGMACIQ